MNTAGTWWRKRRNQLAVGVPVVAALAAVIGYLALAPGGSPGPLPPPGGSTSASPHVSADLRASTKPKPKPKPSPKSPPIGDACLVGTWRDDGNQSSVTYDGTDVAMFGDAGNIDHIAASGKDSDVYGPATLPSYGTYNGSPLEIVTQGTALLSIHANPGKHQLTMTQGGWTAGSTVKYVYQGSTSTVSDNEKVPAILYGYSCTATTLTWTTAGKVFDTETRQSTSP